MQSDLEIVGSSEEPLVLAFLSENVTETRSAGEREIKRERERERERKREKEREEVCVCV